MIAIRKIKSKHFSKIIQLVISNQVLLLLLISALLGITYLIYCNNQYEIVYHKFLEKEIIATVVSSKKETEYQEVYKIKLDQSSIYFLLRVSKNKEISLQYGDKIKIKGKFLVPEEARNYGGFNYKQYLRSQKIHGIFESDNIKVLEHHRAPKMGEISNHIKQKIIKNINQILPENTSQLFLGILIGYDDYLQENLQDNFRKSSLSHILAVSGSHITYLILGITFLLSKMRIPKLIRNVLIGMFLILFMCITGFSSSVVRAGTMVILLLLSVVVGRKNDIQTSMSLSLLIILLENPFKILDVGLLLSYLATIGIVVFSKLRIPIENKKRKIGRQIIAYLKELMLITIFANIFVMPIIIYNFNTISFTFIISNIIAGILMGPITIGGFLLILISFINIKLAYIFSIPYNVLLQFLISVTKMISKIPVSEIMLPTPSIFILFIYYLFLFCFLFISFLRKNNGHRYLVKKIQMFKYFIFQILKERYKLILIVFLIFCLVLKFIPKNLKIYFIDVGQGDSTLVVTPNHKTILIDSGGSESKTFDLGKSTLVPYLLDRGINDIDYICISHFDSDHSQGFIYLLNHIKVKNIILSKQYETSRNFEEIMKIVKEKNVNILVVKAGDTLQIEENVKLKILWPVQKQISENALNNNSMVAKLSYKDFSMLLTGDIEKIAEKQILEEYKNNLQILKSTVLKVGHHGSKTSSILEFLKVVKPKIALIGVGKNNRFGHPNQNVLERLNNLRCEDL